MQVGHTLDCKHKISLKTLPSTNTPLLPSVTKEVLLTSFTWMALPAPMIAGPYGPVGSWPRAGAELKEEIG
jgi:hypothetical protein